MANFSYTITVTAQTFDKQSAEVSYIQKVLELAAAEIGRGRGMTTSGTITGVNPAGVPNSSLGSWSYTAGATNK